MRPEGKKLKFRETKFVHKRSEGLRGDRAFMPAWRNFARRKHGGRKTEKLERDAPTPEGIFRIVVIDSGEEYDAENSGCGCCVMRVPSGPIIDRDEIELVIS